MRFLKQWAILVLILWAGVGFMGCGSSTKTEVKSSQTLGQELMDLDEAFKKGVITEKEYQKARKDLLSGKSR